MGSGTEGWEIMRRGGDGNWKLGCGRFVIQIKPRSLSSFVGPFIEEAMNGFLRFFFSKLASSTQHVATTLILLLLRLWVALELQARIIIGQAKGTPLFGGRRGGAHSQWRELPRIIHGGTRKAFHDTTRLCEESVFIHLFFLSVCIPTPLISLIKK